MISNELTLNLSHDETGPIVKQLTQKKTVSMVIPVNHFSSLVPFLERELVDTLPYVVSSTLTSFPPSLVEDVVDVLCWQLLPFTVCGGGPVGEKPGLITNTTFFQFIAIVKELPVMGFYAEATFKSLRQIQNCRKLSSYVIVWGLRHHR